MRRAGKGAGTRWPSLAQWMWMANCGRRPTGQYWRRSKHFGSLGPWANQKRRCVAAPAAEQGDDGRLGAGSKSLRPRAQLGDRQRPPVVHILGAIGRPAAAPVEERARLAGPIGDLAWRFARARSRIATVMSVLNPKSLPPGPILCIHTEHRRVVLGGLKWTGPRGSKVPCPPIGCSPPRLLHAGRNGPAADR